MRTLSALFSAVIFSIPVSSAIAAPRDFDGDGKSDLVAASTSRSAARTSWSIATARSKLRPRNGALGDALVPDDFDGDGRADAAVVYVSASNLPLEWYIRKSDGTEEVRQFGMPGDTPAIGDYDCDGKADLATVRESNAKMNWLFSLSGGAQAGAIALGSPGARVFGADRDGDGCDELFAVNVEQGDIVWRSRKLNSDSVETVRWGLAGDIPVEPFDLNGDNSADYISVRISKNRHIAYIRYGEGNQQSVSIGPKGSIPFTTNALGENWLAYFDRAKGKVKFLRKTGRAKEVKFGGAKAIFVRPDGSVVQPDQSDRVDAEEYGACEEETFSDGSGGALWKPVSEGKNAGKPVILLPKRLNSGNVRSVKLYNKSGDFLLETSLRYWKGNGDRATFDVPRTAGSLSSAAPLTVRVALKNGSCEDRVVRDPKKRYD